MNTLSNSARPNAIPFGAPAGQLAALAAQLRYQVVQMSHRSGAPHLGSSLSCIDIMVAAYWCTLRIDPTATAHSGRDRFILSKGHAAPALYTALAARGFFPEEWLETFAAHGGHLAEQPAPRVVPGVEFATGSLGHGLPVGCGLTLAARIQNCDYRTLILLSDGECNEGSVWEAALFASAKQLGRLTVVIDYNKWQATGRSDEVLGLSSLRDKWSAFGWDAVELDGHDIPALAAALAPRGEVSGRPRAIIAHTIKGKGVPFMEDDNNWHYRIPTDGEVAQAAQHLQSK